MRLVFYSMQPVSFFKLSFFYTPYLAGTSKVHKSIAITTFQNSKKKEKNIFSIFFGVTLTEHFRTLALTTLQNERSFPKSRLSLFFLCLLCSTAAIFFLFFPFSAIFPFRSLLSPAMEFSIIQRRV